MAVTNTFAPNTTILSAEVNQNFDDCESGAAMNDASIDISFQNTKGVYFQNAATANDAHIFEDANDRLKIENTTVHSDTAFLLDNAKGYYVMDSGGTPRRLLSMDTSDVLELGRIKRQGGSATNWATVGTTDYTTDDFTIQCGAIEINNLGYVTITFGLAFSYTPVIVAQIISGAHNDEALVKSITNTTFQIGLGSDALIETSKNAHWYAIGETA